MSPCAERRHSIWLALALLGCSARAELDRHVAETERALRDVEARGAMGCAPRELAVARSHLEFARLEQDQGFPSRAREHLDIADENVRAAEVLSPSGDCAEGAPPSDG